MVKAGHKTIGIDSGPEDPGTPRSLTQSLLRTPVWCGIPVSKPHAFRTPILHKSGQCRWRKEPSLWVGAFPPLIYVPCYQPQRSEGSAVLCCAAKWRTAKSPGRSPHLQCQGAAWPGAQQRRLLASPVLWDSYLQIAIRNLPCREQEPLSSWGDLKKPRRPWTPPGTAITKCKWVMRERKNSQGFELGSCLSMKQDEPSENAQSPSPVKGIWFLSTSKILLNMSCAKLPLIWSNSQGTLKEMGNQLTRASLANSGATDQTKPTVYFCMPHTLRRNFTFLLVFFQSRAGVPCKSRGNHVTF